MNTATHHSHQNQNDNDASIAHSIDINESTPDTTASNNPTPSLAGDMTRYSTPFRYESNIDHNTSNLTDYDNSTQTEHVNNDAIAHDASDTLLSHIPADNTDTDTDLSYYPDSVTIAAARLAVNNNHNDTQSNIDIHPYTNTSTPKSTNRRSQLPPRNRALDRVLAHDNNATRSRANSVSERVRQTFDFDDSDESQLRQQMRAGMSQHDNTAINREYNNVILPPSNNTNTPTPQLQTIQSNTNNQHNDNAGNISGQTKSISIADQADKHDSSLVSYGYWQWIRPVEQPVNGSQICKWYCNLIVMCSAVIGWVTCITFFMGNLLEVYSGTSLASTVYWDHINIIGLGRSQHIIDHSSLIVPMRQLNSNT